MLYNTFLSPGNLQIRRKAVPLQGVFHSIRFKVNKGWAQRSPFFMPVRLEEGALPPPYFLPFMNGFLTFLKDFPTAARQNHTAR